MLYVFVIFMCDLAAVTLQFPTGINKALLSLHIYPFKCTFDFLFCYNVHLGYIYLL